MANLIILAGIPGCGKSTWAKTLLSEYDRVSSDVIRRSLDRGIYNSGLNQRVFDEFHGAIRILLESDRGVVADATSLTAESRKTLRRIGYERDAYVHLVLFKNIPQALERNHRRSGVERVPDEAMDVMLDKYEQTLKDIWHETYDSVTCIGGVS